MNTHTSHMHLSIGETRARFADISNRVAYSGERIIVDRHDKPLMALVSIDDLHLLETLEEQYDIQLARSRLKTLKQSGTTTLEALKKELDEK